MTPARPLKQRGVLDIERRPFSLLQEVDGGTANWGLSQLAALISSRESSPSQRSGSGRGLWAADELTRHRAGRLTVLVNHLAADDGELVAVGSLDETASTGRQIEDHLRSVQGQAFEIDDINVGLHAGLERAPIVEAIEAR